MSELVPSRFTDKSDDNPSDTKPKEIDVDLANDLDGGGLASWYAKKSAFEKKLAQDMKESVDSPKKIKPKSKATRAIDAADYKGKHMN